MTPLQPLKDQSASPEVTFKLHPYYRGVEFTRVRVWTRNSDFSTWINSGTLVLFHDEWLALAAHLAGKAGVATIEVTDSDPLIPIGGPHPEP